MRVRIRFQAGARIGKKPRKNQHMALAVGSLLTPAAVMAAVLGLWRLAADLDWTSGFAISSGLFSHWQVWMGLAGGLEVGAHWLHRYGTRVESLTEKAPAVRARSRAV